MDDEIPEGDGSRQVPIAAHVVVEQGFNVDGRKLTVQVTFPAQVAKEIGMENVVIAANRALVTMESKTHTIRKLRD